MESRMICRVVPFPTTFSVHNLYFKVTAHRFTVDARIRDGDRVINSTKRAVELVLCW